MVSFEMKMNALLSENNKQPEKPAKRFRHQNFSEPENELLINLAYPEAAILENKKTDQTTNTLKSEVWHAIAEEFNSHRIGDHRDMLALKNRYETLKRRLRKKIVEKKATLADGEVFQMVAPDYEAKLWEMIGSKQDGVEMLASKHDAAEMLGGAVIEVVGNGNEIHFIAADDLDEEQSETVVTNYERSDPRVAPVSPLNVKEEFSQESTRATSDEEEETPTNTRKTPAGGITIIKRANENVETNPPKVRQLLRSTSARLSDDTVNGHYRQIRPKPSNYVTESTVVQSIHPSSTINDLHIKFQEEEHQLKMKNMKEEHEVKMKFLAQEMKMKEEEHAIRMKILKRKLIVICEDI